MLRQGSRKLVQDQRPAACGASPFRDACKGVAPLGERSARTMQSHDDRPPSGDDLVAHARLARGGMRPTGYPDQTPQKRKSGHFQEIRFETRFHASVKNSK
ncbi:hypothetical protein EYF80_067232 [Liparis tanakae]|uniref:Uncharacterized protein n=1 Tax=Liparis tanakae TaxID=230148 RepID=A0A4Z2E1N1_9TELE|nr:hypothetical protein EYF80_067232 [Liparis tanakae]